MEEQKTEPQYWSMVKEHAERHEVEIDINNPRESRLEVALALDKNMEIVEAFEVMKGRSVDYEKDSGAMQLRRLYGGTPKQFYEGIPTID